MKMYGVHVTVGLEPVQQMSEQITKVELSAPTQSSHSNEQRPKTNAQTSSSVVLV